MKPTSTLRAGRDWSSCALVAMTWIWVEPHRSAGRFGSFVCVYHHVGGAHVIADTPITSRFQMPGDIARIGEVFVFLFVQQIIDRKVLARNHQNLVAKQQDKFGLIPLIEHKIASKYSRISGAWFSYCARYFTGSVIAHHWRPHTFSDQP